ncbi:MAG: hypothetical protein H5U40_17540, partial [Polyangiaceae bacterium]|nr:hypothetical protein [Polyangiaceae bacterium]
MRATAAAADARASRSAPKELGGMMSRTIWRSVLLSALALAGCGGGGGDGEEGTTEASGSGAGQNPYAGLEVHEDLLARTHLAEVEHRGLFIDFGTPAQAKYTFGDWRSGWGRSGAEGATTF